jgi:hypothetical protein
LDEFESTKTNQTPKYNLKGLVKIDKESGKYNPSREQVKYEIGQKTTTMKTTNKKIKHSSNKHQSKIVKLMCLYLNIIFVDGIWCRK